MKHLHSISLFLCVVLFTFIYRTAIAQDKTEVLVLGTTHLSNLRDFEHSGLESVLEKLNKHEFDAVGIEAMPTELLNDIRSRKDPTYNAVIEYYGEERLRLQSQFQNKLSSTLVEAEAIIDSLIGLESLDESDRIALISYLLAAGDIPSAALQYSYLDVPENGSDFLIDSAAQAMLGQRLGQPNEIYSIGLKIASERGLPRVEYIDNLQDEPLLLSHFPEFIHDYMKNQEQFKGLSELPVFMAIDSLQQTCIEINDYMPLYEFLNSDAYMKGDYEAQWKLWLTTNFESKTDLSRFALWEMRNLQIAANIQKVCAYHPGERVLIIIGASHKSFLEKYLGECDNIKLLEF